MNSRAVYLVLDFDGVLHHHYAGPFKTDVFDPGTGADGFVRVLNGRIGSTVVVDKFYQPEGSLFDREYHLVSLLEEVPEARIVISTSWRNMISQPWLGECLSPPVRQKVTGVLDRSDAESNSSGVRGQLMVQWLKQRNEPDAVWVALDDHSDHYTGHSDHLVKTHWRGLDQQGVDKAVQKLNEFMRMYSRVNKALSLP